MDGYRFDALIRRLATTSTRRGALALVGVLLASPMSGQRSGYARKKKVSLCFNGQTIKASKKKKKKLLKQGATLGACLPCQDCQNGSCVPKPNGVSCGDGCRECQDGQCVNKPNDTRCVETDITRRCRDGVCKIMPRCDSFTKACTEWGCCFQDPGDLCPLNNACEEKAVNGHRCRFDADCASNSCVGYICDPT